MMHASAQRRLLRPRPADEPVTSRSLRTVLAFTSVYGVFALALLAGQATLRADLRTDLADAAGDLQAPAPAAAGFILRLASAE